MPRDARAHAKGPALLLPVILFIGMWLGLASDAQAHEVRPAYLSVTTDATGLTEMVWKQPVLSDRRLALSPELVGCEARGPTRLERLDGAIVESRRLDCPPAGPDAIRIEGLERTLTDVFVRVEAESTLREGVIGPDAPELDLRGRAPSGAANYIRIGIEHILFGWDHLLFVLGLVFLVPEPRRLLGVATAFTLAHSLTLALSALGAVSVPGRPVEILIAGSLVMLAVEILRRQGGGTSLALRRPYLIAVVIGLVHGLGFAGALADIGLPRERELLALLYFNIGVEVGQFLVIGALLALLLGLEHVRRTRPDALGRGAAYLIGISGCWWVMGRVLVL